MDTKCEACGLISGAEYTKIRTTNGGLTLCGQCLGDINRKNPQIQSERVRRIISDWAVFHGFEDDCDYPLISPSDVVLDDLANRLEASGEPHEIAKEARKQWETVPACKGKERRLRRPAKLLASPDDLEILNCLVRGWANNNAPIPGGVCYQDIFDLIDKLGGEQPTELIHKLEEWAYLPST